MIELNKLNHLVSLVKARFAVESNPSRLGFAHVQIDLMTDCMACVVKRTGKL